MDNRNLNNSKKLFDLKEASQKLNVSVETLIKWNEFNILKPTITVEGTIVYTEDQINQFLLIKQMVHEDKTSSNAFELPYNQSTKNSLDKVWNTQNALENSQVLSNDPESLEYTTDNYINKVLNSSKIRPYIMPVGLSSIALISVISIASFYLLSNGKLNKDFNIEYENKILGSQTSNLEANSVDVSSSVNTQNTSSTIALNQEGENIQNEKIKVQDKLFNTKTADNFENESPDLAILSSKNQSENLDVNAVEAEFKDETLPSYASRATTNENSSSLVFDADGKIKGEAVDTLSTTLGSFGNITSSLPRQINSLPISILSILTIGLLSFVYIFPKGFVFAGKKEDQEPEFTNIKNTVFQKKIIEVDQKTDGTIVLYFYGKEYKISKPELYSESDQFIERLLDRVKPGFKEIEYVSTLNDDMQNNTPLSRLVTRLGFVGIKRDLFFPRTSKDRVLFRKYLTEDDLKDMNLTSTQILAEL